MKVTAVYMIMHRESKYYETTKTKVNKIFLSHVSSCQMYAQQEGTFSYMI